MDRRRLLLLAALALGVSALIASLSAAPPDGSDGDPAPSTTAESPARTGPTRKLALNAARPETQRVARGTHLVLSVEVPGPGEVSVPELGLSANAEPGTPAAFDILAEREGSYDVAFVPAGGETRRAGRRVSGR
jgi:hypothetical protein